MEEDRILHKCWAFFLVQKINKWIITCVKKNLTQHRHTVLLCLLDPILKIVKLLAKKNLCTLG